jgi:hypothetical protein
MNEQVGIAADGVLPSQRQVSVLEILWVSTRLGLTSFGGPIAHLGYFHEEYVNRRKWVDEQSYADLCPARRAAWSDAQSALSAPACSEASCTGLVLRYHPRLR